MISFREIGYWGRLGNQMFQFASTVGISKKVGTEAKFPIENCFVNQQTGPFDPSLGRNMDVKCELVHCFEIPDGFFIPARHIKTDRIYRENDFRFEEIAFKAPINTSVAGYFQTEKYFAHCKEEIRSIFKFRPEIKEKPSQLIEKIKSSGKQVVSVHIRRGDYTQSPNHHPPCGLDYYSRAFLEFDNECFFIIFSDDLDWCRNNFSGENFIFSDLTSDFEEMCSMTFCDHHIIANSSFSWWGAWLNPSPVKKVIAPIKWFGPALVKDTTDIYCDSWIKL